MKFINFYKTKNIPADFLFSLGNSKAILEVSESIYDLLGFKSTDFLNGKQSLKSLIHKDDEDISNIIFSHENIPKFNEVTITNFNLRMRHQDGSIICIKAICKKEFISPDSGPTLELKIQDSKRLWKKQGHGDFTTEFKSMMENTNDYIYFKDRNHVFTGASQTLVNLTEPSEKWTDLLGKTDYDVFPEEYADHYYSLEKQVFAGFPVAHRIQETLDNDGKKGWVDNRKYPIFGENKEIIGLFGIARDITESKEAQESLKKSQTHLENEIDNRTLELKNSLQRFKSYFELPLIGVAITSPEKGWIEVNQKLCDLLGYKQTELFSMTWEQLTHPEDLMKDVAQFNKVLSNKIEGYTLDKRFIRKDRFVIYTEISVRCVRKPDGKVDYFVALINDISERIKAEKKVKETQEQLIHSEKLSTLGRFAGSVAHEFNNPLFGVISLIEQLGDNLTATKRKKFSDLAQKECWRMANMIKNLQSFYRPSDENFSLISIDKLIADILLIAKQALNEKKINVKKEYKTDTFIFKGIEDQIKQVILNIIQNAIDSIPENKFGEITLSFIKTPKFFILKISDTGKGIKKKHMKMIFDPFFTTKGKEGTGLGLSVSYGIIKKHGGDITIESDINVGSTVTLLLPIIKTL